VTRALLLLSALLAGFALGGSAATDRRDDPPGERMQVVVLLSSPSLSAAKSPRAARRIDEEQRRFETALRGSVPGASVHWRYRLVANGVSVILPARELPRLSLIPGVRQVFAPTTYHVLAGPDAATIRARQLPGADLPNAGAGVKIGIIDDGVDQRHRFFDR
jgi:hypothetical protein